jgi:hypothetical protein
LTRIDFNGIIVKSLKEWAEMLEKEWEFYKAHKPELVKDYFNKFVVISGNRLVAAYDDKAKAYNDTVQRLPLGSFLIHQVTDPEKVLRLSPFAKA